MSGAGLGQRVIVSGSAVDAALSRRKVGAWAGHRQHLHGDPARIHVGEPRVAKVGELVALCSLGPDEVRPGETAASDRVGGDAGDDAGYGVVFFQGDDAHLIFLPRAWAGPSCAA